MNDYSDTSFETKAGGTPLPAPAYDGYPDDGLDIKYNLPKCSIL